MPSDCHHLSHSNITACLVDCRPALDRISGSWWFRHKYISAFFVVNHPSRSDLVPKIHSLVPLVLTARPSIHCVRPCSSHLIQSVPILLVAPVVCHSGRVSFGIGVCLCVRERKRGGGSVEDYRRQWSFHVCTVPSSQHQWSSSRCLSSLMYNCSFNVYPIFSPLTLVRRCCILMPVGCRLVVPGMLVGPCRASRQLVSSQSVFVSLSAVPLSSGLLGLVSTPNLLPLCLYRLWVVDVPWSIPWHHPSLVQSSSIVVTSILEV